MAALTVLAAAAGGSLLLGAVGESRGLRGASATWAGRGECGVATNMLDYNEQGMRSFCALGLDFWWNWNHAPRNIYSSACAWKTFVPMVWGYAPNNNIIAKSGAAYLMGYNEPDLWGPPAIAGGDYLAAGTFAPTFHCGGADLAANWRELVMAYKAANPDGQVLSPSMADPDPSGMASTFDDAAQCNASPQTPWSHMRWCAGWLKCFKESVLNVDCGGVNCWDVIDVIQFHAYTHSAEDLISKVQSWENHWADDLTGANGRTRKTLWLTEFARAGATDSSDPDGLTRAFMKESIGYLRSSPYVSGWSWFSQDKTTFVSFPINGVQPTSPRWASELIDQNGQTTVVGEYYGEMCKST